MARLLLLRIDTTDFPEIVKEVECNDLDDYYKYLNCGCFDIATRKIGDKYYDIFVDDEGLFKDNPIMSMANIDNGEPMLVGNLIFANHDDEGNTTSLSDEDMNNIKRHICLVDIVKADRSKETRFIALGSY
ncbi:MAG TPA: hypothetical protein DHV37_05890 [Erysipelotrichaceae bacterium]|nr:hypothetical protein [Erysipelotrichaceae bacterium]